MVPPLLHHQERREAVSRSRRGDDAKHGRVQVRHMRAYGRIPPPMKPPRRLRWGTRDMANYCERHFHWRGVAIRVICILAVLSVTAESIAEPGPIGQWLMNQPLTLWDKGMFEATEAANQAAEYVGKNIGNISYGRAQYDWDNNEIDVLVSVSGYSADTNHENCNKVRRAFISYLADAFVLDNVDRARIILRLNISSWFSHHGYQNQGRDKELGEKMSRIIFVKARLWNTDGGITCRERIMVFDAPSKPGQ